MHHHLILSVVKALQLIFDLRYLADKVVQAEIKRHRKWGARDRRFFAEAVYEIVRWWRYLWAVSGKEISMSESSLLEIFWIWKWLRGDEIYDSSSFNQSCIIKWKNNSHQASLIRAVKESIPDWLDELGKKELGDQWPEILHKLNLRAPIFLRINRLKCNKKELIESLKLDGILATEVKALEDGLHIENSKNLFKTSSFKKGWFEVQDGASQKIAPLLEAKAGDRIIDGCAGAGGKTLHLASLMKNKGKIIALDINEKKLEELKKRAYRNGVDIVETRWIDNSKVVKRLYQSADDLLLDVPCSGLGVLRRNPDTKWKLNLSRLEELKMIQADLLERYSNMVKVGGKMVYSTCSILPSENENQISKFLSNHPEWSIQHQYCFPVGENDFDGFYAAILIRRL